MLRAWRKPLQPFNASATGKGCKRAATLHTLLLRAKRTSAIACDSQQTLFCSCGETKLKSRRHERCPQWLRSRERHLLGKRRELLGLIGQYRKLVLCIAMMGFTAFAD